VKAFGALVRRLLYTVLAAGAAVAVAQPVTQFKVLATDPAPDALLARQQPFYVQFEVRGTAPHSVTVSGWFKGKPVFDNGGTGAPAILAANATGVVSFFYWGEQPTKIDEVRLHLSDAANGAAVADYAFPVALTWLSDDPTPRQPAPWVTAWQQAVNPRVATNERADLPVAAWWLALAAGSFAVVGAWGWRRRRRPPAPAHDDSAAR
jgi:hypothetical protein